MGMRKGFKEVIVRGSLDCRSGTCLERESPPKKSTSIGIWKGRWRSWLVLVDFAFFVISFNLWGGLLLGGFKFYCESHDFEIFLKVF